MRLFSCNESNDFETEACDFMARFTRRQVNHIVLAINFAIAIHENTCSSALFLISSLSTLCGSYSWRKQIFESFRPPTSSSFVIIIMKHHSIARQQTRLHRLI